MKGKQAEYSLKSKTQQAHFLFDHVLMLLSSKNIGKGHQTAWNRFKTLTTLI
jgi:hypothetical protein